MLLFVVWRNGTPTLMCSLVKRERTLQAREQRTHVSEDGCYDGAGDPTQGDPKKQARVPLRFDEAYCCFLVVCLFFVSLSVHRPHCVHAVLKIPRLSVPPSPPAVSVCGAPCLLLSSGWKLCYAEGADQEAAAKDRPPGMAAVPGK